MAQDDARVSSPPHAPPAALTTLLERFDPGVIDVPSGTARIRLVVRREGAWDVVLSADDVAIEVAQDGGHDAELSADAATWRRIADDVRGGMAAFRAGRLRVRRNLHVGIGFLAATSGIVEPGRLRFASVDTSAGRLSTVAAGEGDAVVCVHGLGATKASFLPTLAALAADWRVIAVDLPGVRRVRQAAHRRLRRAVLRRGGDRAARCAGDRAGAPDRQQHGRPGGDRACPAGTRAGGEDGPARPGPGLAARPSLALAPARAAAQAGPGPAGSARDHRADRAGPGARGPRRVVGRRRRR